MTRERSYDIYLSDTYANASGSIVQAHEGPKLQH